MSAFFLSFILFFVTSCSFFTGHKGSTRKEVPGLSIEYAKKRSENISKVQYDLSFDLTKAEKFSGSTKINFQLKKVFPLTVDFAEGEVLQLQVNGRSVSKMKYNKIFIEIPKSYLKRGANEIIISFNHVYSKNGSGLYRFVDPMDKAVYLNTDFEPYDANQLFPCFDQPDLKATYKTNVKTPKKWQVITSVLETKKQEKEGALYWEFPQSQKFSTYIYSLHAGEFTKWESEVRTESQLIPLRLFARKSLAKYIQLADWFVPTQQGFVFFEDYFGYPYPYKKYDQVLVPDFNFGAMENVAAVTFNEDRYVRRGPKTRNDRLRLTNVILHEMAHMWFGNLVTMKWWNDLWLNESFATYMAYKATAEATEFKEGWMNFQTKTKAWAYWTDQLVTTHPIEAAVHNTDEAFANFDGITYGKGASVLKQMAFYIGEENFRSGLATYFHQHANSNTELSDFMGIMATASGKDMSNWQQKWLQTAMLNTISVDYKCTDGKISEFNLSQAASDEYPTLRPHKTKVALVTKNGNVYRVTDSFDVAYDKEKNAVTEAVGKPCPDIVYPNYQDYDFAKVLLDEKSLSHIQQALLSVNDSFLRAMIWWDLWSMLREQKLDVVSFLDIVSSQGLDEPEVNTLRFVLEKVDTSLKSYFPREEKWGQKRFQRIEKLEQVYRDKMKNLKSDPARQRVWFDYYVGLVESQRGLDEFVKILKTGKSDYLSIKIDQDRRWGMLTALSQFNHKDAQALLEKEKKFDNSKKGLQRALVVEAIQPELGVKKTYFQRVSKGPKEDSFGDLRAIMSGLFPANQKKLHQEFVDEFFSKLKGFGLKKDPSFVERFASILAPAFCDGQSSQKIKAFLSKNKTLPKTAEIELKIAAQEDKRCFEIQNKLKQAMKF